MVGLITQIDANIAGSPKAKFSQFVMSVDIAGFLYCFGSGSVRTVWKSNKLNVAYVA